jgi:hypothetical protein
MTAPAGEARLALKARLAAHGLWLCAARLRLLALKAGFDLNQPRVPAGDPAGGQWTSGDDALSAAMTRRLFVPRVQRLAGARRTGAVARNIFPKPQPNWPKGCIPLAQSADGDGVDWNKPTVHTNRETTPQDEQKFVDGHGSDAQDLAQALKRGSNAQEFLTLSSIEAHWGVADAATNANNFFGVHNISSGPFPNQIGTYLASGHDGVVGTMYPCWLSPNDAPGGRKPVAVFPKDTGYMDSGSIAVGRLENLGGDYSNPATFFTNIHKSGWAIGTPLAAYVNLLMGRYRHLSGY